MLETPSIRRYSPHERGSDNPTGADNQQERPGTIGRLDAIDEKLPCSRRSGVGHEDSGILRGHTQSSRLKQWDEDMVHAS